MTGMAMPDKLIPPDIRQFILQNIDSVAQLEGLLLLRAKPEEKWGAEGIAKRLYIDEAEAAELLAQLAARGLLAAEKDPLLYRYWPRTPAQDEAVKEVAAFYAKHILPVTHLIHSKSRNRVQEFADAFRIRKDKKDK